MTLRTKETQQKYEQYLKENNLGCFLCLTDGDRIGEYWKIRENDYPYDQIAKDHHILYLNNHHEEPSREALNELTEIKKLLNYDALIENSHPTQSVPHHYHLHVIRYVV